MIALHCVVDVLLPAAKTPETVVTIRKRGGEKERESVCERDRKAERRR